MTASHVEIIEYYDRHPDVTLRELSMRTGYSIQELKQILMNQ